MSRRRRRLLGAALVLLFPWVALVIAAAATPLPPELREGPAAYGPSARVLDRNGVLLREVRAEGGVRATWVSLDEVGPDVVRAMLAAEDRRFFRHPGIDPIAIVRATAQAIVSRRFVSGASTITQQLARNLVPRPRTLRGKLGEMALALRIEASLSKRRILEEYLNRVAFGPDARGIDAASRTLLDKRPRDLSLAEAAMLASLPRGPSLYDPRKGTEAVRRRRDRVLARMLASGAATEDEVRRATNEPIALPKGGAAPGTAHFIRAVLSGALDTGAGGALRGRASAVTITVDRALQREIEVIVRTAVDARAHERVSAAAVVVLENRTGDVLAYVGSPGIDDVARLGHNDGVLAKRQPGSALKPFVYGLAMERLGMTPATLLPDVETVFPTPLGEYRPENYDGRFHGPVRLREALACSYNVPAVWTAARLGPEAVLERLRALGLGTLSESATHYGVAIALGDGEVRLLDLANAYATLARGGVWKPVRAVREATGVDGRPIPISEPPERRVMDEAAAWAVTHVLSDDKARIASFGENSALDLPFAAAAKTGTSKAFRDNVAVGYTPEVTVAVWVGNFDGSPMQGVSGVSGAGPIFRDAMLAAARVRPPSAFPAAGDLADEVEVCSLSGAPKTDACPHTRIEFLPRIGGARARPVAPCAMHERVRVERVTGLRAGPRCADDAVEERVFERFPAELLAWARAAGRPLAPEAYSPLCPGEDEGPRERRDRLAIAFPSDGATFVRDPSVGSRQSIRVRADVPAGARGVRFVVDGRTTPVPRPPYVLDWPLTPGEHRIRVEADGLPPSEPVEVTVEE